MSVINGQNADATTFNSAFASKSQDNTLQGKQTLARPGSGATVVDTQQAINDVIASDALKIPTAEKGVANGVATLDATTHVPVAQIPDLTASKITDFNTAADARITLQKGAASGIAPLDGSSKIDSSYLPSYVDDVVEVANYAALPVTGETGKIYVTLDTNKTYRWSGSVYVQIGQPIASTSDVPEGTNLYFTSARVADKQIGIQFQDQGTNLGTTATVDTIDFIGAGIQATRASNKVTVEVTATGGGGSKNYFSQSSINPDFETATVTPWSACTLTFSGGVPSGAPTLSATQMAISVSSSSPLAGTNSMLLTKSAANAQYQGYISGAMTIDKEDTAKVLYGSFYYELVSGTIDFSGSSTQSLEIWIYNTVSGQWIQPAGYRGMNQSSGVGKVVFSFQTDGTYANNSYKLAIITQQTSTSAYVVKFDDFVIGPQAIVLGSAMTDWQSYGSSASYTGFGTVSSNSQFYRRVGDSIELMIKFTAGTGTATEARIALPNGLISADTSKIPSISICGSFGGTTNSYHNTVTIEPSVGYITFSLQNGTSSSFTKLQGTAFSTQTVSVIARLPIQGFGSYSQMSSDTDTRTVTFQGNRSSTQSVTADTTNIAFTAVKDSHGAWTGNTYIAPISGDYFITCTLQDASTTLDRADLYINGTRNQFGGTTGNSTYATSAWLAPNIKAGDIISVRCNQNTTLASSINLSISRISGGSVITATETVAASYYISAASLTVNTSQINFDGRNFDSFNAVTTGASWRFTAPISGTFEVTCHLLHSAGANTQVNIHKNGTVFASMIYLDPTVYENAGSLLIKLNAGDYIDLRNTSSYTFVGTTLSTQRGYININRVGN